MDLTITLSQDERDHILGWVNKGIAEPAFADNPYRIVLEERTRARFDQVRGQFYPPTPAPAPMPIPPDNWPIDMQPPMLSRETRRSGDATFPGPWANPRMVLCIPIPIPASPQEYTQSSLGFSVTEWDRPGPSPKQLSLSRTPGDFRSPLAMVQGVSPLALVTVGASKMVKPGETIYANIRFWNPDTNAPSTDDAKQGVSFGGGPWPNGLAPTPGDPFADVKFRQTVGSWAAFSPNFLTNVESNGLKAAHPHLAGTLDRIAAYYGPGGWGNVNGIRVGNDFLFDNFKTGKREPDVDGAADKFILANSSGIAPPSITIP